MVYREIDKAAYDYIHGPDVPAMSMQLAFGDFINGAEWALEKVKKFLDDNIVIRDHLDDNGRAIGYRVDIKFTSKEELMNALSEYFGDDSK
jgi:hypothetical protein